METLARLAEPALDGWVASASVAGRAHLVPLSVAWTGELIILAVELTSLTARNIMESPSAESRWTPPRT